MKIKFYISVCFVLSFLNLFGQPGSLDLSFNSRLQSPASVYDLAKVGDNILIAGYFQNYDQVTVNNICMVDSTGALVSSFTQNAGSGTASTGGSPEVKRCFVQNDGKILITGNFTSYNGINKTKIARLNPNGQLDLAFDCGSGLSVPGDFIYSFAIQDDNKIIIAGDFNIFNGYSCGNILRLNEDGTIDGTFNCTTNTVIQDVKIQGDGKLILVGNFTSCNGTNVDKIVRINNNGSIDNTFSTIFGTNQSILSCALQNDKILIAGVFQSFELEDVGYLARLNNDGSLDYSFNSFLGANNPITIVKIVDEKILIGGTFQSYNGVNRKSIARLKVNGDLDIGFDSEIGANTTVTNIIEFNNKIIIGGSFISYDNQPTFRLAKLNNNDSKGIYGNIFLDFDENCIKNITELFGPENVKIQIQPNNVIIEANYNGKYFINSLTQGNYTATIDTTNTNWTVTCPITQSFTVVHPDSLIIAPSFGVISNNPCQEPKISIHMPTMRPCFTNQLIYVQACNEYDATGILADPYSIVELDSNLIFENSSIPFT